MIADDNFATIVAAVEEGRVVYRNIKKAVLLLFSTSAAEVVVLLLAMLLGYPPPFAAVQILWNNLVTEGLITVNLVMEPAEGDEMRRPPISRRRAAADALAAAPAWPSWSRRSCSSTLGWFVCAARRRRARGAGRDRDLHPAGDLRVVQRPQLPLRDEVRAHARAAANRWLLGGLVVGNLLQVAVVFWAPLGRVFHTVPFGLAIVVALGSSAAWCCGSRSPASGSCAGASGGADSGKMRVARAPSGPIHEGRSSGAANSRTRSSAPARS